MSNRDKEQEKTTAQHAKIDADQAKINEGQREINGALCYVDWHVIYAINAVMKALKDAGVLTDAQLADAKLESDRAYYTSRRVASIDPPGCGTEFPILKEPDIKAA